MWRVLCVKYALVECPCWVAGKTADKENTMSVLRQKSLFAEGNDQLKSGILVGDLKVYKYTFITATLTRNGDACRYS